MIAPTPYDRVQYTLSFIGEPSLTIQEIRNWGTDEKEYSRNSDYDGIFAKFSNSLEFVGDGKDFVLYIYEGYGINADILLRKEERHPLTDVWTETYAGYLDLSTLDIGENMVTVKLNSGGLEQLLKVREGEQIEVDRLTTMDGKALDPINTIDVPLDGRRIFLLSKLENSVPEQIVTNSRYLTPTQEKVISSDEHIKSTDLNFLDQSYFVGWNSGDDTKTFPQRQQFFYENNDRLKYVELVFDININIGFNNQTPIAQFVKIKIQKSKEVGNPDPEPVELRDIILFQGNGGLHTQNFTYSNRQNPFIIELQAGESLAIVWEFYMDQINNFKNVLDIIQNDLTVTENSFFEATKCTMILAHDLGQRLSEVITNKDVFYSNDLGIKGQNDYIENGIASSTGFAHGFWIREFFKDEEDEENRFKPLTTSWSDFMEAMRVTWKMGVGIDFKGKTERLRMERKSFFYNPNVTIKLPNIVSNLKRSIATEYYFSGIEAGYSKGGEYEESMGLDEYNGKSTFTTVITRLKNIFKIVSPYRTDSYGVEFARRKTRRYYPIEDTRYDQDIFQFDLKEQEYQWQDTNYIIRKWQDDFAEEPENVYSPETAFNLRYSPANLILRHGWEIASSFIKYPLDYIRYGSSTANSKLITKLYGGEAIAENEDILNSKLGKAKFVPEWVTFEHEADFFTMQKVEGFSNILGKEIPNFYGLIEYKINDTEIERGYLFNLKPNGIGQWRVLRANR